jgi:hypothetical protein
MLIGFCCVGFFIADVATPTCFKNPFPAMLALGVVTAQLTVICVWGTLVSGTFWVRLPWTLLLLVLSWCGFAWGITLENKAADTESMLGAAAFWAFGFVASFVPLKIATMCFHWQIKLTSTNDHDGIEDSHYSIRDIMIGTLFLALSMGIGRAMLPNEEISFRNALAASGLDNAEPLLAVSIYSIVSLLVKLPCIWIALDKHTEKMRARIGCWGAYCFLLAIIEISLLIAFLGSPGTKSGQLFSGMVVSHQVMGAIILSVCYTLRGLGYQLERAPARRDNGAQDIGSITGGR